MIFTDDKDKETASQHLPTLKDHPAWKYIDRALAENVEHFTNQLRTRKDFKSLEELSHLQDRIDDIEAFRALPQTLLAVALDRVPDQEDDAVYRRPASRDLTIH